MSSLYTARYLASPPQGSTSGIQVANLEDTPSHTNIGQLGTRERTQRWKLFSTPSVSWLRWRALACGFGRVRASPPDAKLAANRSALSSTGFVPSPYCFPPFPRATTFRRNRQSSRSRIPRDRRSKSGHTNKAPGLPVRAARLRQVLCRLGCLRTPVGFYAGLLQPKS